MSEEKPMTIGEIRKAIKYLNDEIPIYLESGDNHLHFSCLSIEPKTIYDRYGIHSDDHPLSPQKILLNSDWVHALCFRFQKEMSDD